MIQRPQTACPRRHAARDARGRKWYRYHPRWRAVRDETKYTRLIAFAAALPVIRRTVELRARHVEVEGSTLTFEFRGKGGRMHGVGVSDRRVARIVRRCRELPGQELFEYVDENGERRTISSGDVNDDLRTLSGEDFTSVTAAKRNVVRAVAPGRSAARRSPRMACGRTKPPSSVSCGRKVCERLRHELSAERCNSFPGARAGCEAIVRADAGMRRVPQRHDACVIVHRSANREGARCSAATSSRSRSS
jgi:DNA topoisomerase IB